MEAEYRINNEADLQAVIGEPMEFLQVKVVSALDEAMQEFIRAAPLVFVSTLDEQGRPDLSPKGDPNGFTQIDPQGNLILPERPGNRLTFGFKNLLRDNRIGLIYVVPGMRETLRVKGVASLHRDPDMLQSLAVNGKPALLYTYVQVQECFFHCGKAMIRSKAWKPDSWGTMDHSPMARQLSEVMSGDRSIEKDIEAEVEKSYTEELY